MPRFSEFKMKRKSSFILVYGYLIFLKSNWNVLIFIIFIVLFFLNEQDQSILKYFDLEGKRVGGK